MRIHYISAIPGAGKTETIIHDAIAKAYNGEKILIAQPTNRLLDATEARILNAGFSGLIRTIHGDCVDRPVGEITRHLTETHSDGEILLVTQQAFDRVPYIHRRSDWYLMNDEVPEVHLHHDYLIPDTHHVITSYLDHHPIDDRYSILLPRDQSRIKSMAKNIKKDRFLAELAPLLNALIRPDWTTYVLTESYEKLLNSAGDRHKLLAYSLRNPSSYKGFKDVLIAGACFKQTFLYHLWQNRDVEFVEARDLTERLRYQAHANGRLLTTYYGYERKWSKAFRNQPGIYDKLISAVTAEMKDRRFLWMANQDQNDDLFGLSSYQERLPGMPHGLNQYTDWHDVAILSALNPTPDHQAFLKYHGLSDEQIWTAFTQILIYQTVMRCSLRDQENGNPKTVIVPDLMTASFLQTQFPGSNIKSLGIDDGIVSTPKKRGRKQVYASEEERIKNRNERRRLKRNLAKSQIQSDVLVPQTSDSLRLPHTISPFETHGTIKAIDTYDYVTTKITYTIYRSLGASQPMIQDTCDNNEVFMEKLKEIHKSNKPNSKQENLFMSTAIFDPGLAKTNRGIKNVVIAHGIWLDNDGGELSAEGFAELFPTLRVVAFSTYSSTRLCPRYRVYVPTSEPVSAKDYRSIARGILRHLEEFGYDHTKPHGFDVSKMNASDLFALPCQCANPADSFFFDFNETGRDLLVPEAWASEMAIPHPTKIQFKLGEEQISFRETAIEQWRADSSHSGKGNDNFFSLGMKLAKSGMDASELCTILEMEAQFAISPSERLSQIPSIINSLRNYGLLH